MKLAKRMTTPETPDAAARELLEALDALPEPRRGLLIAEMTSMARRLGPKAPRPRRPRLVVARRPSWVSVPADTLEARPDVVGLGHYPPHSPMEDAMERFARLDTEGDTAA